MVRANRRPDVLGVARSLVAAGGRELAADGVPLPEALESLWPALRRPGD
jgi:hypothetical protein